MHSFPADMANYMVKKRWRLGAINSPWAWERACRDQRVHLLMMVCERVATFSFPLTTSF